MTEVKKEEKQVELSKYDNYFLKGIKNIEEDRQRVITLLDEVKEMSNKVKDYTTDNNLDQIEILDTLKAFSDTSSKYVEVLQKSNEQFVKLINLKQKDEIENKKIDILKRQMGESEDTLNDSDIKNLQNFMVSNK